MGGGSPLGGTTNIAGTTITGNRAATSDPDVDNNFTP